MKVGIVGLPNVGKSTLFKAITKKQVDCANFPFCTIEPNHGIVAVPDKRVHKLAELSKSEKEIPATVEFVDIAGLVRGASKGEGLGNKFLSHIREVDAIVEVVRGFTDPNIIHVSGEVNPKSDIEVINYELIYADLETLGRRIQDLESKMKAGRARGLEKALGAAEKLKKALNSGALASSVLLDDEEKLLVRDLHLLTTKPFLYVLNIDEVSLKNKNFEISDLPQPVLPLCVKLEAELAELDEVEARELLSGYELQESGLDKLIRESYKILNLITYFTTGPEETRAWTIVRGMTAREAAGVIHTDFEKGFIAAEVIAYNDFVDSGNELKAKEKGLLRLEGRDYIMRDGDVCHFRFSI